MVAASVELPDWSRVFLRLFELYFESDRDSPQNWFQQQGVADALAAQHSKLRCLEAELEELDPIAWNHFKSKAKNYVHTVDRWGYNNQLFECFHEVKGYLFLKQEGYQDIRFIEEQQHVLTPDLEARPNASVVLMEVKTVNESEKQKDYFEVPPEDRNAVRGEYNLPKEFKRKLLATIDKARDQLLACQGATIQRRIVYIVVRPDFNFHGQNKLETFLKAQSDSALEVVPCLIE